MLAKTRLELEVAFGIDAAGLTVSRQDADIVGGDIAFTITVAEIVTTALPGSGALRPHSLGRGIRGAPFRRIPTPDRSFGGGNVRPR